MPVVTPIEVFCSYAHEDEAWLRKLETHLSLLQKQGLVSLWHDRLISPGTDWARSIDSRLETASIVLLLISANFIASDYCFGVEMERALLREKAGEARVIPILVRKSDWKDAPFAHLQVLPSNTKPVATWTDVDSALADVAAGLRHVIAEVSTHPANLSAGAPTIWNIPYSHYQFFTGRENELKQLHTQLQRQISAAIGHMQAISGPGGVGKTRLAVEYAYRYRDEYTTILWAGADNEELLIASYSEIAQLLKLPEKDSKERTAIVQAVKKWLRTQRDYLLILDNADEPDLLASFVPPAPGGHLLLTTRSAAVRRFNIANPLVLSALSPDQGALFLLHSAGLLAQDSSLEQADQEYQRQAQDISRELGGLPLALEQTGAYLDETGTNLASYLQIYKQHRIQLLKENQPLTYSNTVATTWDISFHKVEQRDPAAADLLRFCAFLAPDGIPEEILTKGAEFLGPRLSPVAKDAYLLNQSIATLRAYSLIARDPREHTLAIHRLIQAVVHDNLDPSQQCIWVGRVIDALNKAIPELPLMQWQAWLPYLPQVSTCSQLIDEYSLFSENAGKLLYQGGVMLRYYSRPAEAQEMYERALRIYEHILDPEHPEIAATLDTLATTVASQRRYEQALDLFTRALHIREHTLGPEHPDTAATINGIGLLYSHWRQFEKSQHMYERALRIRERVLGSEHRDTAVTLVNLAMLYRTWQKYDKAEELYLQALHIYERSLGPEHSITISTLNDLTGVYRLQGKYEQAEALLKRILAIQERKVGLQHPATANAMNNLAYLYSTQGAYEQSLVKYEQTLHIRQQIFGNDHPNATITYFNMGQLYQKMGNYQRAEELFLHALKTHEQVLGMEHSKVFMILEVYAGLLRTLGQDEKAGQIEGRAKLSRGKIALSDDNGARST